jgi:aspartokinase
MNRSLRDLIAITTDLKAVYDSYLKDAKDGKISTEEALALAAQAIEVLNKHSVTLAELSEILSSIGPLLSLLNLK